MRPHNCIHIDRLDTPQINWINRNLPQVELSSSYIADDEVIILMEPYLIDQEYFSLYGIWADFWAKNYGNEKTSYIKVIGIALQSQCPNYLDMFLPKIEDWIEQATPRPRDQYLQVSESLDLNGKDIRVPIRKLLKGHGKTPFFKIFDDVYGILDTVNKKIKEGVSYSTLKAFLLEDITEDQVILLRKKWEQNVKYFRFLPLEWQLAPYEEAFELLDKFVKNQSYDKEIFFESSMLRQFQKVFLILEEMRRMYVF